MVVSDYLKEKFCLVDLQATDKEGAIKELSEVLSAGGKIIDQEAFRKDVLEREDLGSTGIGNNVGIPHARTKAVKGFVVAFGRSTSGIEFKALDGEKVNLIFLMGADPGELNLYLRILAELSKLLMNGTFRETLISAKSAAEVIAAVKKFEQ
ncbi:MAG: PTS sugar transporter subunit IIA [Candidatus Omnitrophica bacterium]|nr:PTS sugar transporter subunit IIA [Candidatus Omnitrophota bacterium]